MNTLDQIIATALLVSIALFTPQAGAITRTVDCDKDQTIQDALDRGKGSTEQLDIIISGTCNESVSISRNDVTITASDTVNCPGATVNGGLFINGASRIEVTCISVTSEEEEDLSGIETINSTVLIKDVNLWGNGRVGLEVTGHSSAAIIGGSITNNSEDGVIIDSGSNVGFENTSITGHPGFGVSIYENSAAIFEGGAITGNGDSGVDADSNSVISMTSTLVSNNGADGVAISEGSRAYIMSANLTNNSSNGLFVSTGSSANIRLSTISSNGENGIYIGRHSWAEVFSDQIFSNTLVGIAIATDSGVVIDGVGTSITDPVSCDSKESSVQNLSPSAVNINCVDPEF